MAHTHTASPAPAAPPPPPRYEFDCWLCDRQEFTATPGLPEGWNALSIDGGNHALCPDCSSWLEKDR